MPPTQVGRYQIQRKLATGGMAEIFLARQQGMEGVERTVVIKKILQHRARDAEFVTMFLDEARIVATLVHPNIAQIYELGKEDDAYFIVMEYVRGPDLGKILDTIYESGGRGLPLRIALPIIIGVCEALHYIHEKRDEHGTPLAIVHRDINPQNVVVSYEGAVKLIDFGIAKAKIKVYETRTGVIKGTYGYMAPEQLTRKAPIDRRSDVFALGVLLYESILGVHPFEASDEVSLLGHIVRGDYRRPRAVRADFPEELERVILGCLAPRPEQRTPDTRTVQLHLEEFMAANHLVVSMARLGDFVRDVVPEGAPKRPATGREPDRVLIDGPTPQNPRFPTPDDSVMKALKGPEEDPDDFGDPVFPPYDEDTTGFDPTLGPFPVGVGAGDSSSGLALTPSSPLPMAFEAPTRPGPSLATLLASDTVTPSGHRNEDSAVSQLTVLGKKRGPATSRPGIPAIGPLPPPPVMPPPAMPPPPRMDMPPVSTLGRLGPTLDTRLPARPSFWKSPTARGVALVALAAAGGALLAAVGVAVLAEEEPTVAVSPEPPAASPAPVVVRHTPPGGLPEPHATPLEKAPVLPPPSPVLPPLPPPAPPSTAPAAEVTPTAAPPAAPIPHTLQIQSTPPGALIWINGRQQPRPTPASIELPADAPAFVTVRVFRAGYQPMEREVEVISGTSVFELQRASPRRRPTKHTTTTRRRGRGH